MSRRSDKIIPGEDEGKYKKVRGSASAPSIVCAGCQQPYLTKKMLYRIAVPEGHMCYKCPHCGIYNTVPKESL